MCYVEHEKCYRGGIVQRDVSTNNIIISNGEGHLIDFDHAKFTGRFKSVANSVPERIRESWRQELLSEFDEAVISRAEEMMGNPGKALSYLVELQGDIEIGEPLTFQDLGWCEKVSPARPSYGKLADVSPSYTLSPLSVRVILGLVVSQ